MSDLSPHARALLDDARAAPCAPDPAAVARIEKALLASSAALAVGLAGTKATSTWTAVVAGKAGLVSLLVVTVVGTTALVRASRDQRPPAPAVGQRPGLAAEGAERVGDDALAGEAHVEAVHQPVAPKELADAGAPPLEVAASATVHEEASVKPSTKRRAPSREPVGLVTTQPTQPATPPPVSEPTPSRTPPDASRLAAELALLKAARSHVDAHEWSAALELLEQHDVRFGDGALRLESDVLRVLAWCGLGKTEDASRLAAALAGAGSPAKVRLMGSCVDP